MTMIVFPHAKLNLGLYVLGKRPDGYHELETAFFPVPLCDVLEVRTASELETDRLTVYGTVETGHLEDNLVLRAVRALRGHYPIPALEIYLYKGIPSGAGLGGGSADASFMLRLLNDLLGLGCSLEELARLALTLGADCPFFIYGVPAIGRGIGEQLQPLPTLSLRGLCLTIVKPELHIRTADAFRGVPQTEPGATSLEELLAQPPATWRTRLHNAFEISLFPKYPILAELKQLLYDRGAIYTSLTGSGAALYALSEEPLELKGASPGLFLYQCRL